MGSESRELFFSARLDAASHVGRGLPKLGGTQFLHPEGGGLDVQIDAIQQGTAYSGSIALHLRYGTTTFPGGISQITAWARVHGGNQHEVARESDLSCATGYRDFAFLQGLTKHLQGGTLEFRQFVEEEHAVVGQRDFSGPRNGSAATLESRSNYRLSRGMM